MGLKYRLTVATVAVVLGSSCSGAAYASSVSSAFNQTIAANVLVAKTSDGPGHYEWDLRGAGYTYFELDHDGKAAEWFHQIGRDAFAMSVFDAQPCMHRERGHWTRASRLQRLVYANPAFLREPVTERVKRTATGTTIVATYEDPVEISVAGTRLVLRLDRSGRMTAVRYEDTHGTFTSTIRYPKTIKHRAVPHPICPAA